MLMEQGLRYNEGKTQWSLLPWDQLESMIKVLEYGAHKYSVFQDDKGNLIKGKDITVADSKKLKLISSGRDNWKKGFPINELWDSNLRHTRSLMTGELLDNESGLPHIGHILCNVVFLSDMYLKENQLK
jgi:hypothetical protein